MNRRSMIKMFAGLPVVPLVAGAAMAPAKTDAPIALFTQRVADMAAGLIWSMAPRDMEFMPPHRSAAMPRDVVNTPVDMGEFLGSIRTEFDSHYEATLAIPCAADTGRIRECVMPACIALSERMRGARGAHMFSRLPDAEPSRGAISKHSECRGVVVRATLACSPTPSQQLLTIDVLYGRAGADGNSTTIIVNTMDAKSFVENSDKIASAAQQALQRNHPLLGTLRAIV